MSGLKIQKQHLLLYRILKYGGLLAVGILAMGSILSALKGMPASASCNTLSAIVTGLIGLKAICWFILGLIVLMSIPVVVLITVFSYSLIEKDLRLTAITLLISALLIGALFYSG